MKEKKNPLLFWGIITLILVMVGLVIVPMMTMRGTMADTTKQLNEKYNDDFLMTWTDIDDTPMGDTFVAIMKSNKTGITYDAKIVEGVATMEYEKENFNAAINDVVEATMTNSFAMADAVDGALNLRVLTTSVVDEAAAAALAEQLKAEFDVKTVVIETMQITDEQLKEASNEIDQYYQRSTIAKNESFDKYKPARSEFNF